MRCHSCASENSAQSSFCETCGRPLVTHCPQCARQNSALADCCTECGAALHGNGTLSDSSTRSVPDSGERKLVTILFADIVDSTQAIALLDVEEAMERLHPAVEVMCRVVRSHEGVVMSTLGDGIMAIFGAPRAQEGHALLACQAALAMQKELKPELGNPIRVGMHSGEVVSSIWNSDITRDPDVHGVSIHLASRIQKAARPGEIWISGQCYRLVRAFCHARALGQQWLRGFPQPLELFSLVSLKPAVASQQFSGALLTKFRGRSDELTALLSALQSTQNAHARVVGISGPPGMGKSRLCYEFAELCRSQNIPVLEARALPYGHATPLQPVLEFLRLLFRISSLDDAVAARHRVEQFLLALDPSFMGDLPVLYDFLGLHDKTQRAPVLDPKARHVRLLDIVKRIVQSAGATTSVIIVEDLHWLDEASEEFVSTLVDAIPSTRALLIVNYRPAYSASWMTCSHFQHIWLPELSLADTTSIVEELVGHDPLLTGFRQRLAERSQGNPFFAEELIRSSVASGILVGQYGSYSPGKLSDEAALPDTVQAVVASRIDRIPEADKGVLQVGSICGKEFSFKVLQRVIGIEDSTLNEVLARLCSAELLQQQTFGQNRLYAFRHPLIQEVVYASQLKTRRRTLHAFVAKATEEFHKDRVDEISGLLAYHYEAAGQSINAANAATRAAMWIGNSNTAQALKLWRKVRILLQSEVRSAATDTLRIMASGQIVNVGWREGMAAEEARPFFDEAIHWAREANDTASEMLLLACYGRIVAASGPADEYVNHAKEALRLATGDERSIRAAFLNAVLSHAYRLAGKLREALVANSTAFDILFKSEHLDQDLGAFKVQQILGFDLKLWVLATRGRILARLGSLAEAEKTLNLVIESEAKLFDPTVQFIPHLCYVEIAELRRDVALAEKHSSCLAAIAQKSGIPYLKVYQLACSASSKFIDRDFFAAIQDFSRAIEYARSAKAALEYEPEILSSLASSYLGAGQTDRAASTAKEAAEVAKARNARLAECRALITYGAAILTSPAPMALSQAQDAFARAEELIRTTGAAIYQPILEQEMVNLVDRAAIH